jgi:preprotein translocase subunit SecY
MFLTSIHSMFTLMFSPAGELGHISSFSIRCCKNTQGQGLAVLNNSLSLSLCSRSAVSCLHLGGGSAIAGVLYLPTNVLLIAFFNYFYTFLQLDPADVSEQLKRQGASIPSVRPGKATATFITNVGAKILSSVSSVYPLIS